MQTPSSRIWTRVAEFSSYSDNRYASNTRYIDYYTFIYILRKKALFTKTLFLIIKYLSLIIKERIIFFFYY